MSMRSRSIERLLAFPPDRWLLRGSRPFGRHSWIQGVVPGEVAGFAVHRRPRDPNAGRARPPSCSGGPSLSDFRGPAGDPERAMHRRVPAMPEPVASAFPPAIRHIVSLVDSLEAAIEAQGDWRPNRGRTGFASGHERAKAANALRITSTPAFATSLITGEEGRYVRHRTIHR